MREWRRASWLRLCPLSMSAFSKLAGELAPFMGELSELSDDAFWALWAAQLTLLLHIDPHCNAGVEAGLLAPLMSALDECRLQTRR